MVSETEKRRDMNQKEKNLLEWVRNIGFVHQNIEITDTVHGRGLVATEDLPADTVIIKVFYVKILSSQFCLGFLKSPKRKTSRLLAKKII